MPFYRNIKVVTFAAGVLFSTSVGATIVAEWNEAALAEVRLSKLGPPMVARALAIAHTCMYDAWARYDQVADATIGFPENQRRASEGTNANKEQAISFAAYRCLVNLFPAGRERLAAVPVGYRYDYTDISTDTTTPVGIGNVAAQAVIDARSGDGSNQYGDLHPGAYSDYTGYTPRNPPMGFCTPLLTDCPELVVYDPDHWQPLIGPPPPNGTSATQQCIGMHWENVTPFALTSAKQFDNIVPKPDVIKNAAHYEQNVDEVLRFSADLDATSKLNVEYWADGPASELPPGHWGLFAQFVSHHRLERDNNTIDEDVKMFFAMHNASFDAGIVAWHFKRKYDGVRPITAIRYLKQGQMVLAWAGPNQSPSTQRILGEKWTPYNPGSNLTPAFPGYISGHSIFSSASATVLRLFTGNDNFGFLDVIPANFGRVEPGIPAEDTPILFATFSEAAQKAGLSRIQGGIHFPDDITVGYDLGVLIGQKAWDTAQTYFNGTAR
jgi:hypothetical protein